jgi:predicted permease
MTTLLQDIRYALRQLRKTPGFTATAILTLALGIGANAAIFSLVNAVLLKNLPVTDPATLIRLGDNADCCVNGGYPENQDYTLFPTETWRLIQKSVPEFEDLAAMQAGFSYRPVTVRRNNAPVAQSLSGEFVSGNYFRTFGIRPEKGRLLTDSDDVQGAPTMAVISYQAWQREYAGDPSIIGSTFWIDTMPVTIAGIAPQGFYGDRLSPTPPDFYFPIESMAALENAPFVHDPDTSWLYLIGRVKPRTNLSALQQKLTALVRQSRSDSKIYSGVAGKKQLEKVHVVLTPGGAGIQDLHDNYASNLRTLMIISGLVLLIACANIANLLLVRGMARKTEMSVRTALGAARGRIARQLLTESLVLALLSGAAGLIVAYAGTHMLLALAFPGAQNVPIHAEPSPVVLAFAFLLSLLTGVLFGVAPAWIAAQADPADALRSGSRTTATGASLLQRALVILQAALSLVLLIGAGLFAQSLSKLQNADLKLDTKNRYIVHINPQGAGYSQTQLDALYRQIDQRFHAIPGVVNVGIASYTPMEDDNWGTGIQVLGQPELDKSSSVVRISPEFFNSVGTRVLMGRGITEQDVPGSTNVAVVNKNFVETFFKPGVNPIGQHFGHPRPDSVGDYEIVGVVEDTAYNTVRWKHHEMYFLPLMQRPASDKDPIEKDESLYAEAIVIQTSHPEQNIEELARNTLASINPNLTIVKFQTFSQQIADRFNDDRMVARLTMLFGALALLLATIGLYGVTAFTVARRTSEIGIRMALGADRSGVIAMVMRGALIQAAIGLAIGIPVAYICVRFIQSQLYDVTGLSPAVLTTAILTLIAAATLAGLIPARRAASTDPAKALRTE